jgi:adenine-specific DNA methylase
MSETQDKQPVSASLFEGVEPTEAKGEKTRKKRTNGAAESASGHLPPNLDEPLAVKVPDFSNPFRPKTCLEVDFPLVPINALSALEGNAGKPIYQMSKWWARRRSCVFRALLLAAAMEAPVKRRADGQPMLSPEGKPVVDEDAAAQAVWDAYYANHQAAGNFKNLKVLDPFMGGGTTLVEGSRLGFQVAGVDLNPVAWFIVKNELACTEPKEVKAFFDQIEADVKPQVQPFYVTDGIGGRRGTWFKASCPSSGSPGDGLGEGHRDKMPADFDPIMLPPADRKPYLYDGPEIIYTFWAKHGPCSKLGCGHRTPIFRSPVVATKRLGVKYVECTCKKCKSIFHAELGDARIAPDAEHVVLENEHPYTVISQQFAERLMEYGQGRKGDKIQRVRELSALVENEPGLKCPNCGEFAGQRVRDVLAMHRHATRAADIDKKHLGIQPSRNSVKAIYCTLLIDPEWFRGSSGAASDGTEMGGHADAPVDATAAWYCERLKSLRLIEVRGSAGSGASRAESVDEDEAAQITLPPIIRLADGRDVNTLAETIARKANGKEWDSHFICAACGTPQDFRLSVQATRRTAPVAAYVIQAYDRVRDEEARPYGGRFFKTPGEADIERLVAADREWTWRKDADLDGCWPREELPRAYMTHQANFALPEQGYTHWYKMFNPRQLVVHASLLTTITAGVAAEPVRHQALGALQQYLRMQNMFVFWHITYDKIAPSLSNPNFHPKNNVVENNVFGAMGYGTWLSCAATVVEALEWCKAPREPAVAPEGLSSKTVKCQMTDSVLAAFDVRCGSSSEMSFAAPFDLVITDPPFGDNVYYSDLSNFFYAWLRLPLRKPYPDLFEPPKTPNAQEALKPRWLPDAQGDQYYYDRLAPCWAEACRLMKDGGLLAFTFHHSEPAQWEIVLRSLFDAGFYLEAAYPIASDEMKGEAGQFGAKGTEYDIVHVCRKRLEEPKAVSWPKMRQWVKSEFLRVRPLLEAYRARGLADADVHLILMGKALEFYSRHYGKVLVSAPGGEERVLSIRDALSGINQILDEAGSQPGERPPSIVQPVVYQYLRLFGTKVSYSRDEVSKLLRGTAIQPRQFEQVGSTPWIVEEAKVVTRVPIYDRFQKMRQRPRRELKTELDQAHFLIGAAMPPRPSDSGVNIEKELERETFLIRPGVEALLDWYSKTPAGADEPDVPQMAVLALTLLRAAFEAKRARIRLEQPLLWDEWEAATTVAAS